MDKKSAALQGFLHKQTMLDLNLTLAQLTERLGTGGEVAGYTFAWDKYVYHTSDLASEKGITARPMRKTILGEGVINLNVKMADLISLARDTGIDEVAGYVYTEDKFTFIVASFDQIANVANQR